MPDLTTIAGSSYECGRTLGRLQKRALLDRIAATRAVGRQNPTATSKIPDRVREFASVLRRVAPEWLAEAKGTADGAGVETDELLMLNCLPTDFYPPSNGDCTSFVEIGPERNRLLKIRDNRNHVQCLVVQATDERPLLQFGRDIGNLGVAHALNRHGLAGASNTGSTTDRASDAPRLNDCHILRFVVERAASVDQVPAAFEELLLHNAAGGACKGRGAILLLADAERGLILESVEDDYAATFVDRGLTAVSNHFLAPKAQAWENAPPNTNTVRRLERMEQLLRTHTPSPTDPDVFAISRDRENTPDSLCNDDDEHFWMTVSAQLHVIPRHQPDRAVTYACCGNTRHSLYLPVPVGTDESFVPLANGDFYALADCLYRKHRCSPHLQTTQTAFESDLPGRRDPRQAWSDAYDLLRRATEEA